MTDNERRDIVFRLENWGRCYQEKRVIGVSPTGAFCDRIKREKLGEQPSNERRRLDPADADVLEKAITKLQARDVRLLVLCYIDKTDYSEICRKMKFPYRQQAVFIAALRQAQAAVQALVERGQNFHSEQNLLTANELSSKFGVTT